jgi:pre-rRNA-processing protein TSR1
MFPISSKTFLKSKIQFIAPSRDISQLIDLAKCADIICPVLSCKSTNTQGMNLDPFIEGKAFDDIGYTILNMLRSFGVPTTVGVIQHLEVHPQKQHDKITRLFKRFLTSELGEEERVLAVSNPNDLNKLIRTIDSINLKTQAWKSQRGYLLVENITKTISGQVVLQGFLKGNCVNAN